MRSMCASNQPVGVTGRDKEDRQDREDVVRNISFPARMIESNNH